MYLWISIIIWNIKHKYKHNHDIGNMCTYIYIYTYMEYMVGLHKWGYPKIDGFFHGKSIL